MTPKYMFKMGLELINKGNFHTVKMLNISLDFSMKSSFTCVKNVKH